MRIILFLFLSISFLISDSYSWEDGGTILGSYGNLSDPANVGPTNGITPYDGDYMLTVSEYPISDTPQAFIAWVTDISDGDEITACFYGYDDTPGASSSMRVWGSWSDNNDITSYAGTADGNTDYTAGTGWDQVCHTFSTSQENWESGSALVVQARLYSSSSATSAVQYFIDLVEVTTSSSTATIHFPGPVAGVVADAGEDQSVDAGDTVTLDGSGSFHTDGTISEYFWEQVSGPGVVLSSEEDAIVTFTAPNESASLSFDLTVSDATGDDSTDTVNIEVILSEGNLTIAQIQGNDTSSPYVDDYVTTTGIVTANAYNGFFIQDSENVRSGIWVIDDFAAISVGDEVQITGLVEEEYGLTQIDISTTNTYSVLSSNNDLFDPITISLGSEDYESMLVTASGTCEPLGDDWDTYQEWELNTGTNNVWIDNLIHDFTPTVGSAYTVVGPLYYGYSKFRISPRDDNDIEVMNTTDLIKDFSIFETYPNPFNPTISIEFSTLNTEIVEVSIYNIMGHKLETLFNGIVQSNELKRLNWNGSKYSSGEYIVSLKTDNYSKTDKITLIK